MHQATPVRCTFSALTAQGPEALSVTASDEVADAFTSKSPPPRRLSASAGNRIVWFFSVGHVAGAFTGAIGEKMGKFLQADGGCRIESVHFRHLHVHQDEVIRFFFISGQRLPAVRGNDDSMPALFQQSDGERLVDQIVFGQQDAQPTLRSRLRLGNSRTGRFPDQGGIVGEN